MMNEDLKETLHSTVQAIFMIALVVAVLFSPVRTEKVLAVEEPVTYVEIDKDMFLYGQDVVQDDLHKRLGL